MVGVLARKTPLAATNALARPLIVFSVPVVAYAVIAISIRVPDEGQGPGIDSEAAGPSASLDPCDSYRRKGEGFCALQMQLCVLLPQEILP